MRNATKIQAGLALLLAPYIAQAADEVRRPLEQGWSEAQKGDWYNTSQGSRLIPRDWLMALEQADNEQKFLLPSHTESFRYLTDAPAAPLPLGFVVDTQRDLLFSTSRLRWKKNQGDRAAWVGLNCAACHTSEITFQGSRLRIDGGPAQADFQGYIKALNDALAATRRDSPKWRRFGDAVLGAGSDAASRAVLAKEVDKLLAWQLKAEQANATELKYGYARLDAFGHIFNKVLLRAGGDNPQRNPSDAPVSYPFLWNIHQHDKVQWNASVSNLQIGQTDFGAVVRNVGEVTGVFADLTLRPRGPVKNLIGYTTSADVTGLLKLEGLVSQLKPPVWPQQFPPIDVAKWERGKVLFDQACAGCHLPLRRNDLSTHFTANRSPVFGPQPLGTDPWMACNAFTYQARTGVLEGTRKNLLVGARYGSSALVSDLLGTTVIGSIYNRRNELIDATLTRQRVEELLAGGHHFDPHKPLNAAEAALAADVLQVLPPPGSKEQRLARCQEPQNADSVVYKGRPLTGIWATGPYLHNGSVPTLYDLLLPPEQRPVVFALGTREFDPVNVGFVTDKTPAPYLTERAQLENTFVFRTRDAAGMPIAGNSNAGHDYGNATWTVEQRYALVEYMKAVGAVRNGDQLEP